MFKVTECIHKWEEVKTTKIEPFSIGNVKHFDKVDIALQTYEKMLFGATEVLMKCDRCGSLKKVEMLGEIK